MSKCFTQCLTYSLQYNKYIYEFAMLLLFERSEYFVDHCVLCELLHYTLMYGYPWCVTVYCYNVLCNIYLKLFR